MTAHNLGEPVCGHPQLESERVRAEVTRIKLSLQDLARMYRRHFDAAKKFEDLVHCLTCCISSVRFVGNLHLIGIAIPELEDDSPLGVHINRPEFSQRSFEPVKSDTVQLAEVLERCRC